MITSQTKIRNRTIAMSNTTSMRWGSSGKLRTAPLRSIGDCVILSKQGKDDPSPRKTTTLVLLLLGLIGMYHGCTGCGGAEGLVSRIFQLRKLVSELWQKKGRKNDCVKHFQRRCTPTLVQPRRSIILPLVTLVVSASDLLTASAAPTDLRSNIIHGFERCFEFFPGRKEFKLNCTMLLWSRRYKADDYISLSSNETFEGAGHTIDLHTVTEFEGLFRIKSVASFAEAPVVRNVHIKNGTTASHGGFIFQRHQRFFVVESCSSSGAITNDGAGGICGRECGSDGGRIKVVNSHSTGHIVGINAGGIIGSHTGRFRGMATIERCFSTGDIQGQDAGGICGFSAGERYGHIDIYESFSTGRIGAVSSGCGTGGIVGAGAGKSQGTVRIKECFSTGEIPGEHSGGIVGATIAMNNGDVHVTDCYTVGNITGEEAGGITGSHTGGGDLSASGDVRLAKCYASGFVASHNGGCLIGQIPETASGNILVKYSVYRGNEGAPIVGKDAGQNLVPIGNSDNLAGIRGTLYSFSGTRRWNESVWTPNGSGSLPVLRFQMRQLPTMLPTPTRNETRANSSGHTTATSQGNRLTRRLPMTSCKIYP
eukprot:gb/GECG01004457.1/.p1 GENE.gb/GECG01004457.1/~~gb/GECG01004457.1/.p1  ORF type:complete len:595 (+),score=50.63 gb/GECG01004457.1/:1-1785(+)